MIKRPTQGTPKVVYDPATKRAARSDGTLIYEGPCRLWQVTGGGSTTFQDKEVVITTTYLSIPWNNEGEPKDIVTITASVDDELVGRSLNIEAVTRGGGLRGSRVYRVAFVDFEEEGEI